MQKTLTLNKPLGKTPLEVLEEYKNKQPEYADIKMAYAGRLDPMAEGKLLVLVGEECKKRDKYLNLDKEYEFEVLLGVSSDTSDILGITDFSTITKPERVSVAGLDFWTRLDHVIKNLQGKQNFPYPAFSSKTVEGKPLFLWALENKLHEIQIPTKEAEVYSLRHIETTLIKSSDLHTQIQTKIDRITPVVVESKQLGQDFRRKEVLKTWENNLNLEEIQEREFTVLKFRCVCSSGTYMRTLASIIGKELGSAGLAWSITRTKIGNFKKIFRGFGLWTKQY